MRVNSSLTRLIIFLSFVFLFPFVQKQWFNLSSFNTSNFSFYSIIYYLSWTICPIIVSFYSLKRFTYYNFEINKLNNNKTIKGKNLFFLIAFILIPLSFLLINYFIINIDLALNIFLNNSSLSNISLTKYSYLIIITCIFLIFRKCRVILKKFIILNFILITFFIWYAQVNNIFISQKYLIKNYFILENNNYINIIFLLIIEMMYYFWNYISNDTNLSDWSVPINIKNNIFYIQKIFSFYLLIIIYYSILT